MEAASSPASQRPLVCDNHSIESREQEFSADSARRTCVFFFLSLENSSYCAVIVGENGRGRPAGLCPTVQCCRTEAISFSNTHQLIEERSLHGATSRFFASFFAHDKRRWTTQTSCFRSSSPRVLQQRAIFCVVFFLQKKRKMCSLSLALSFNHSFPPRPLFAFCLPLTSSDDHHHQVVVAAFVLEEEKEEEEGKI